MRKKEKEKTRGWIQIGESHTRGVETLQAETCDQEHRVCYVQGATIITNGRDHRAKVNCKSEVYIMSNIS